jgi:hypothetical protein
MEIAISNETPSMVIAGVNYYCRVHQSLFNSLTSTSGRSLEPSSHSEK